MREAGHERGCFPIRALALLEAPWVWRRRCAVHRCIRPRWRRLARREQRGDDLRSPHAQCRARRDAALVERGKQRVESGGDFIGIASEFFLRECEERLEFCSGEIACERGEVFCEERRGEVVVVLEKLHAGFRGIFAGCGEEKIERRFQIFVRQSFESDAGDAPVPLQVIAQCNARGVDEMTVGLVGRAEEIEQCLEIPRRAVNRESLHCTAAHEGVAVIERAAECIANEGSFSGEGARRKIFPQAVIRGGDSRGVRAHKRIMVCNCGGECGLFQRIQPCERPERIQFLKCAHRRGERGFERGDCPGSVHVAEFVQRERAACEICRAEFFHPAGDVRRQRAVVRE